MITTNDGVEPGALIGFANAYYIVIQANNPAKHSPQTLKVIRVATRPLHQLKVSRPSGVIEMLEVFHSCVALLIVPPGGLATIKGGTE